MMDRWLFHWPHSVWKMPDALAVPPVLLMRMIREPGPSQGRSAGSRHFSPKRAVSSDLALPLHWDSL